WHGLKTTLRLMAHNKVGSVGFLAVIFFILLSFIGPLIVPLDRTTKVDQIYAATSWAHPLGTDFSGRDVLSYVIHGGREVLIIAFLAGAISTLIAITLGSLSALAGGAVDNAIMGVADIVLTIPQFPLLIVLAGLLRLDSVLLLAVILGLLSWPSLSRAIRAQVLSLRERDFVEAARALDLGVGHIILREIMPNMASYLAVSLIFAMTAAVYAQVGLVFLGLVPMSGTNWGVMLQLAWTKGAIFYPKAFWYIMGPVFAIALFQLSLVFASRSLEEVFNPRLRTGV
ncbi:MAG: transporter permease, partial [Chloroflexota bacterium]|nr:transporter permease [Chloroflexota bacterium]